MNMNKFIFSFKKENLILEKDKTKEKSKNKPDIAKAVGKRKTPKRKNIYQYSNNLFEYLRKLLVNIIFFIQRLYTLYASCRIRTCIA